MKALLGFIRLLRPINLGIIVLTMCVIRYYVIGPILAGQEYDFVLSTIEFSMLVASTVLLAAAGNIINDYFDMRVDRINKPDSVILGKLVKRRWAMLIHFILNFTAVGIGVWLAFRVGIWELFTIHAFAATSLWFYSVIFKRQFLIGNIVIALLSALVPLMLALFEMPLLVETYGADLAEYYSINYPNEDPKFIFNLMYAFIIGYAAFAFITTLIREIQKDMADIEGDKAVGCNTVPISLGVKTTKFIVGFLIAVTIGILLYLQFAHFHHPHSLYYILGAICLPMAVSAVLTMRATVRKEHIIAGRIMKLAMLGGILMPIFINFFVY